MRSVLIAMVMSVTLGGCVGFTDLAPGMPAEQVATIKTMAEIHQLDGQPCKMGFWGTRVRVPAGERDFHLTFTYRNEYGGASFTRRFRYAVEGGHTYTIETRFLDGRTFVVKDVQTKTVTLIGE